MNSGMRPLASSLIHQGHELARVHLVDFLIDEGDRGIGVSHPLLGYLQRYPVQ